jgi:peptidoglycan/LPS O-acetylase OafA/YrhL
VVYTRDKFPRPATTLHRLEVLDLLRGVAAVGVLIYHSHVFLGFRLLPNAYLAVDMFFMLSGFVIAHNYDSRVRHGMTLGEFMGHRFIRLYPCYALALALGALLGGARMIRDAGYVDTSGMIGTLAPNLFMLPSITPLFGKYCLYPFNAVSWSLLFELIANGLYWVSHRHMSGGRLTALLAVSGLAYVVSVRYVGTADIGMRNGEALFGLARVTTTFFAGVAIRRYMQGVLPIRPGAAGIAVVVLVMLASFSLSTFASASSRAVGDLLIVMVLYPVLLTAVSSSERPGWLSRVCRTAGNISYPVYVLQAPIALLLAAVPEVFFHRRAIAWAPLYGYSVIVFVIVLSWFVDRYYELPLRRALKERLFPGTRSAAGEVRQSV